MTDRTPARKFGFPDHRAPTGKHSKGRNRDTVWQGTSRVLDPAGRKRKNQASWRKIVSDARPTTIEPTTIESES